MAALGNGDELSVIEESEDAGVDDIETLPLQDNKTKKKRKGPALRKAPQAPKRFKSSYICFFMAKQSEIKKELGESASIESVSKRSSELWRSLSQEERKDWNDIAAKDKQRFLDEKKAYIGPWKVSSRRQKKDPAAPRRPMSAFLFFSVGKRKELSEKNPDMKNTGISRILGQMWRSLTDNERRPFVQKEKDEREKYTAAMKAWKQKKEEDKQKVRSNTPLGFPPGMNLSFMFHGPYAARLGCPPTAYPFAANAKQPIVLSPTGMPHWKPPSQVTKIIPLPANQPQLNLAIFDDMMPPDPSFD
ncbi:high mobility group protein B4 [Fistulifera solaris]|uniref:High mobility group protein B4 n=1 Tax=Fistulifera solaris TaxID=1519565 RepID=A0A1Z5K7E0_FISSO|nr:high mobility group protein B4 [Fistulifera solaris]|eukprot:GAX22157.1 high mobility group protein B4 [Fistulifera solaris]